MNRASPERVGLFGGTFDPIHVGHLAAAVAARHQLSLDRVLVEVAADPWQKEGRVVAGAEDRLAMVAATVAGVDGLEVSRLEIDRSGPTFTIDTVEQLEAPGRSVFLIVGADVAPGLETWHRADALRAAVTLAIVGREGDAPTLVPGWAVVPVVMPRLDISSTDIRRRRAEGVPIDGLVAPDAIRVMLGRRLYTPA